MQRALFSFIGLMVAIGLVLGSLKFLDYYRQRQFSDRNTTPAFVELDPIYLAFVQDNEVTASEAWYFVIETREGGPHRLVLEQRTQLRGLYTKYLKALATRRLPDNLDNMDYVKQQLVMASKEYLGGNVVKQVLLKSRLRTSLPTL